jgi:hypothetical protein
MAPTQAVADWYDSFHDGTYLEAPGVWDIDDPCWTVYHIIPEAPALHQTTIEEGWLRLYSNNTILAAVSVAAPHDGDLDPNTSAVWWDDTMTRYLLAKVFYSGGTADPNDDRGRATLLIMGDPVTWNAMLFELDFDAALASDDDYPYSHHASLQGGSAFSWELFRRIWIEPNGIHDPNYEDPNDPDFWASEDANDTTWVPHIEGKHKRDPNYDDTSWYGVNIDDWEQEGFWMVVQFEVDPNFPNKPGDPNGKYLKGAMWIGGKHDWDGKWLLEGELASNWVQGDPNDGYNPGPGFSGVMAWTGIYLNFFPADCSYDELEARIGVFTNVFRTLTVTMKDCSELTIDPDLLEDPNQAFNAIDPNHKDDPNYFEINDPNYYNPPLDPSLLRRYTNGTAIVLSAVVPKGNKTFKKWVVKGPNGTGDPLYQIVSDTNEVLYLTMDGDYLVKATCKCGGGGLEPFAGMVLLVLGLAVVVRRLT